MLPAAVLLAIITQHPVVRAEQFLAQLGGPRYSAREQAGQQLVHLGRHALPALRRGAAYPDAEVAERCKRLIPHAEVEAIRQRVAFLLDTPPKPVPADVPRARRFFAIAGDTREARELYVDLYVAHARLLDDVDQAGDAGGKVFWHWVDTSCGRSDDDETAGQMGRAPAPRRIPSRADLTAFLFLSADTTLRPAPSPAVRSSEFPLFRGDAAREAFAGPRASPAMRALLFA